MKNFPIPTRSIRSGNSSVLLDFIASSSKISAFLLNLSLICSRKMLHSSGLKNMALISKLPSVKHQFLLFKISRNISSHILNYTLSLTAHLELPLILDQCWGTRKHDYSMLQSYILIVMIIHKQHEVVHVNT